MDDFLINSQYRRPIITNSIPLPNSNQTQSSTPSVSFEDVLATQLRNNTSIEFSKHAFNRIVERNIDISQEQLSRLDEGVKIASDKGLTETLILVDSTAFVVNVKNNKVITTVNQENLKGNVFTNIDGTVII